MFYSNSTWWFTYWYVYIYIYMIWLVLITWFRISSFNLVGLRLLLPSLSTWFCSLPHFSLFFFRLGASPLFRAMVVNFFCCSFTRWLSSSNPLDWHVVIILCFLPYLLFLWWFSFVLMPWHRCWVGGCFLWIWCIIWLTRYPVTGFVLDL